MTVAPAATVLLVEDDVLIARATRRLLEPKVGVHHVRSEDEALRVLRRERLDGAWIDLQLGNDPDAGFKVLDAIAGRLPCVVVTGRSDPRLANRAASRAAVFVQKPATAEAVAPWMSRVLATTLEAPRLAALVADLATEWRLSPMQHAVFVSLMKRESREAFASRYEISPFTYERHVSALLSRAKAKTREQLVIDVLLRFVR